VDFEEGHALEQSLLVGMQMFWTRRALPILRLPISSDGKKLSDKDRRIG